MARRNLRRRIAAGEVDLEGLGIKRLTVPKKHIEALPHRVWLNSQDCGDKAPSKDISSFDQTSCSICLEDYESQRSIIRQLPCRHIYHVTCIDSFLLKRSSLCPLCKQSVLPKGYIPPDALLTSATIMRERRRRREQFRSARIAPSVDEADIEMQNNETSRRTTTGPADLTNLAPDNDEEAQITGSTRLHRFWTSLFPSRA